MENTSKSAAKPIGPRDRAYYRRRQQNRVFARIANFFAREAEMGRVSKKELAERLGKDPAQISRWLAHPSNLELDTISDLLLAMNAEMDHQITRFDDRMKPNYAHPWIVKLQSQASPSHQKRIQKEEDTGSSSSSQISVRIG